MSELPKTFDPAAIEARWYAHWEAEGLFRPERGRGGAVDDRHPAAQRHRHLHIGHALDNTLQDILTRHARLQGKDALWVVGTDHAGIATQMVVERQLDEQPGSKRTDFSREDFVAKVWEWKAESGGTITRQLRRLGASCDWANEHFTMDAGFTTARWSKCSSSSTAKACSTATSAWSIGTPISRPRSPTSRSRPARCRAILAPHAIRSADGSRRRSRSPPPGPRRCSPTWRSRCIPSDERYAALVGKQIRLPITGRLIPIVADEHADPELGSGAVKITPGHDFNDFEVGKRAGFKPAEMLNMLDAEARVVQTADGLIPESCSASTASRRASAWSRCSRPQGCSNRSRTA